MGCRAQPVRYPISRTVQQMTRETRMGQPSYTEFRILPFPRHLVHYSNTLVQDLLVYRPIWLEMLYPRRLAFVGGCGRSVTAAS